MTLAFLHVDAAADAVARSPLADHTEAAGAVFEERAGWSVATSFGRAAEERAACRSAVGWADVSHLGKLELQGDLSAVDGLPAEPGAATRAAHAWWCRIAPTRALILCDAPATVGARDALRDARGVAVVDVTGAFGALCLAGPLARELFARFCALDLRAGSLPIGGVRPGSVARMPGVVLREEADRFVWLFGAAYAGYAWQVVADAGRRLGGRPVGVDATSHA
jgi:heterotetrameric sarcosine oxidase gamma subunit